MKNFLSRFFKVLFLSSLAALIAVSCSKTDGPGGDDDPDDGTVPPQWACTLKSISFAPKDNPGLTTTCSHRLLDGTYYVTIPIGVPLDNLKATFNVSDGAKVEIDGKTMTSGVTPHDYSKLVRVKVTSMDGSASAYYYVNVQNGIDKIDKMVYDFMEKYSIPGISVSIAHKGKLVYARGYGYADKDNYERLEPNYMLRLASCSKPFASMCIMRLLDEGKLKLTDRPFALGGVLYEQFPDHKANFEQMTIRSFLEHTSGINQAAKFDPMFDNTITKPLSNIETIKYVVKNFDSNYAPGEKYQYSNFGYCVLGRVVEAITGMPYEDYLKQAVLEPAGAKNIRVGTNGQANRLPNESVYYSQDGTNGYGNDMKRLDSCGGLIASTPDLMRMACALDGQDDRPDIFPQYILDLMVTPSAAYRYYALGWRVGHSLFPGAAYHSGNLAGTATMWARNYNGDTHCAILCNSRSYLDQSSGSFDDALYVLLSRVMATGNWPDQDLFPEFE